MPKLNKLKPISRNEIINEIAKEDLNENMISDGSHVLEGSSLEDYEKAQMNEMKNEYGSSEEKLLEEISFLKGEIDKITSEKKILEDELSKIKQELEKSDSIKSELEYTKKTLDSVQNENDELILKNSELEFSIIELKDSIRKTTENAVQEGRVYTKPTYNPIGTVRGNGFRTNMNGYQEWR